MNKYSVRFLDDGWYVLKLGGMCAIKVAGPFSSESIAKMQLKEKNGY
jgi:hypothetical protein